jgi:hypothetical protein
MDPCPLSLLEKWEYKKHSDWEPNAFVISNHCDKTISSFSQTKFSPFG